MALTYRRKRLAPRHFDRALSQIRRLPVFAGSHRKQQANEVGVLGEVVLEEFFQDHHLNYQDARTCTTHDYVMESGTTVDVKTKERTVRPKSDYDNSIPLYNHTHQRPDFFYFVSLMRTPDRTTKGVRRFVEAHILGGIAWDQGETLGTRWQAGEVDPANGTQFWTDCLNIRMADLLENQVMIDRLHQGTGS